MISPDHAVRSPFAASAVISVHWNSLRFEMPSAAGDAVQSQRVCGTPIWERLPLRTIAFDHAFAPSVQDGSTSRNVSIV